MAFKMKFVILAFFVNDSNEKGKTELIDNPILPFLTLFKIAVLFPIPEPLKEKLIRTNLCVGLIPLSCPLQ